MEIFRVFGSILLKDNDVDKKLDEIDKQTEKAGKTFDGLGETISKWSKIAVAAVGATALALGGLAVKSAGDLQGAMNDLQASTGTVDDSMSSMKDTLLSIYNNNFGESFDDISKSMSDINKVTWQTGDELKNTTEQALLMRDSFGYEVSDSINAVNSLMKNFGISSKEAYTLIAQGAQSGADKNGDLLDTLNEYSVQFSKLGLNAEDFTNILISGSESGTFSIDKVGDAVKEFAIRAVDGSSTTKLGFDQIGLSATDMATKFGQGGESAKSAFNETLTALLSIQDPLLQQQTGVALFGTQFEDLGIKGISALVNIGDNANMTADTLDKMNSVKYNTFGEALEGIKRNLETAVLIPLGEKVLPKLSEFANWIQSHMPEIKQWVEDALNVVLGLFDKFAIGIDWVKQNADWLIPILAGVLGGIVAFEVISTIATLFTTLSGVMTAVSTAGGIMNAVMAANPIGAVALVIGTLIAAGVALYENWDVVSAKASEIFGYIGDFVGGIIDGIKEGFKGMVNSVINGLNAMIRGLNKLKFTVPDWVPGIGGEGFSFNIPTIPSFAVGTKYLPKDMLIQAHEGEMIVPKSENPYANTSKNILPNSTETRTEIRDIYVQIDGETFVKVANPYFDKNNGKNLNLAERGVLV